jgi:hypothetical protein
MSDSFVVSAVAFRGVWATEFRIFEGNYHKLSADYGVWKPLRIRDQQLGELPKLRGFPKLFTRKTSLPRSSYRLSLPTKVRAVRKPLPDAGRGMGRGSFYFCKRSTIDAQA